MMSYSQIVDDAERAARKAKRAGKLPHFIGALGDDAVRREAARIPFMGDYVPRGWERLHVGQTFGDEFGYGTADHECLFVDSSGFGSPGELAMTFGQFAEFTQRNPGYAYGIREAGQFQIVLAVYRRRLMKEKRAATRNERILEHGYAASLRPNGRRLSAREEQEQQISYAEARRAAIARQSQPDATVEQHGSLALVRWHTDEARDWIRDNVQDDAQYFGGALVVEPRYVAPLVEGMIASGLVIA